MSLTGRKLKVQRTSTGIADKVNLGGKTTPRAA
jgi:hypothetical protein